MNSWLLCEAQRTFKPRNGSEIVNGVCLPEREVHLFQRRPSSVPSCAQRWVVHGPNMSHDNDRDVLTSEADPASDLEQTLLPAAYACLRAIAAGQRRRMSVATLNTTALVNEAFLRIA